MPASTTARPTLFERYTSLVASALGLEPGTGTAGGSARGAFTLPPLPYATSALAPVIDTRTMELHHGKHHRAYVDKLDAALKNHRSLAAKPLHTLLESLDTLPAAIRKAVRDNGGGHANHSMLWEIMGPPGEGSQAPTGALAEAIAKSFGSLDKMKAAVEAEGAGQFGSGWVFVLVAPDGGLSIETRPNQDSPLMDGKRPLLGNDLWEHAYYLTYENRRADYLKAWWAVVNWDAVARRYDAARAGTLTV
ncbi:Manganese superoxide dismutase [Rhodovulum sp. PH10]|uniref:superoxide dismutase n=1 Tax=Rhodovulum sp. PH10 TaxID=1187851 RepID=UPI00027C2EE2|nr:superoxide dismutase [Rhodovulum sp. PH10]EJW09847.1 Manganese superoxide dismutase [Rhodovulum sp. PH10]